MTFTSRRVRLGGARLDVERLGADFRRRSADGPFGGRRRELHPRLGRHAHAGDANSANGINWGGHASIESGAKLQLQDADKANLEARRRSPPGGRLASLNGALLGAGQGSPQPDLPRSAGNFTNDGMVIGPSGTHV